MARQDIFPRTITPGDNLDLHFGHHEGIVFDNRELGAPALNGAMRAAREAGVLGHMATPARIVRDVRYVA